MSDWKRHITMTEKTSSRPKGTRRKALSPTSRKATAKKLACAAHRRTPAPVTKRRVNKRSGAGAFHGRAFAQGASRTTQSGFNNTRGTSAGARGVFRFVQKASSDTRESSRIKHATVPRCSRAKGIDRKRVAARKTARRLTGAAQKLLACTLAIALCSPFILMGLMPAWAENTEARYLPTAAHDATALQASVTDSVADAPSSPSEGGVPAPGSVSPNTDISDPATNPVPTPTPPETNDPAAEDDTDTQTDPTASEAGSSEGSEVPSLDTGQTPAGADTQSEGATKEPSDSLDNSQAQSDGLEKDSVGDQKAALKDSEQDTAHHVTAAVKSALSEKLKPEAKVGDVIEAISDEGVALKFHITSDATVEFGTGTSPTEKNTTVDYSYTGTISIPSQVTHDGATYTVTAIAANALSPYYIGFSKYPCRASGIKIPSTVATIGSMAFSSMNALKNIEIPASVTNIGTAAFLSSGLRTVVFAEGTTISYFSSYLFEDTSISSLDFIPSSVTKLGDGVFRGCRLLKTAVIPAAIASMGTGVFASCTSLAESYFESGSPITEIPAATFSGCASLAHYEFSPIIASVESNAFRESGLRNVTIPTTLTYLGEGVFSECKRLDSCVFEEGHGILKISDGLFKNCQQLSSIELPSAIRSIGAEAFSGSGIASIKIPATVTSMGAFAFQKCTALQTLVFLGNANYLSCEPSTFYLSNQITAVVFMGKKAPTLTFPSSMPTIYYTLSYYLSDDIEGQTPHATYSIAANEIPSTAPQSAIYAGNYLPTTPSGGAWAYESGFDVTTEMTDSFYAYVKEATEELNVGDTFVAYTIEGVPVTYTVESLPEGEQPGGVRAGWHDDDGWHQAIRTDTTGAVTLPERVVGSDGKTYAVAGIGENAFLDCSRIMTVTIPQTVTSVGERAFSRCTALRNVYFEGDASTIHSNTMFAGCGSIKLVVFGDKKANVSFGVSSPMVYYTIRYYESKHDLQIGNVQANVVVRQRALPGNLAASDIKSGEVPDLKVGYEWSYEQGFAADKPLTDSCYAYAAGLGIRADIEVRGGNVDKTPCWFRVLSYDETAGRGTVEVGLGIDGVDVRAINTAVSGMPVIPSTITDEEGRVYDVVGVGDFAFGSESEWLACHYIEAVDLPTSISYIGTSAFQNCQLVDRITIPANVHILGERAFMNNYKLSSLRFLGNGLQVIPDRAFYSCYSLPQINIPEGVTSIGTKAFADCAYSSPATGTTGLLGVTLPSTLLSIGSYAFSGDMLLGSIDFPASLQEIGREAYGSCINVSVIRFNGNASNIKVGANAFFFYVYKRSSVLDAVIFMDKKSEDVPRQIFSANSEGKPRDYTTYYCIAFYDSQQSFNEGNRMSSLVIKQNVSAIYWGGASYSGIFPTLGEGSTWRCESGFAVDRPTQDSYYAIAGYDLSKATVTFAQTDFSYNNTYITPTPIVTWVDGRLLTEGVHYTIARYANNKHGPTAYCFVSGINDYAGMAIGTFNISLKVDSDSSFTATMADNYHYIYDGSAKCPDVHVEATLLGEPYDPVEGIDYSISYQDNVRASNEAKVIISGMGIFEGSYTYLFTIAPMSILECTITGLKTTYSLFDGYAEPTVEITNPQGVKLVEGSDYQVSYSGNTKAGMGSIRITGRGNYTDTMAKTYSVRGGGGGQGTGTGPGKGSGSGSALPSSGSADAGNGPGSGYAVSVGRSSAKPTQAAVNPEATADGLEAGAASGGGGGYSIYQLSAADVADVVVEVQQSWWWVPVLILACLSPIVGFARQKRWFRLQLRQKPQTGGVS